VQNFSASSLRGFTGYERPSLNARSTPTRQRSCFARRARAIDSTSYVVVLLGGDARLRAGEMRALRWTDVDLSASKLRIECSE